MLPGIVHEGEDDAKTLAVDYTRLIPVLIKGMQDQQAQIEELKSRVLASNPSFQTAGPTSASEMSAPSVAPQVTVIRQSVGPSDGMLMALTAAILVFAFALFAVALRIPRRRAPLGR